MKRLFLLLCGAGLLTAGCSSNPNTYATYGEYGYTFDLVPQPVPGISAPEVQRMYGMNTGAPTEAAPYVAP